MTTKPLVRAIFAISPRKNYMCVNVLLCGSEEGHIEREHDCCYSTK